MNNSLCKQNISYNIILIELLAKFIFFSINFYTEKEIIFLS